jgi:bacteriocin biosynthesis cyclodehydratase domain-containing protein
MEDSQSTCPVIDAAAAVIPLGDNRVQIRTPSERVTIGRHAELAVQLIRLCDGARSIDDIVHELVAEGHLEQEVRDLYSFLMRRAVLALDARPADEDTLIAHARHFAQRAWGGAPPVDCTHPSQIVQVCGSGKLADAIRADLTWLGISQATSEGDDEVHLFVACSDYDGHVGFREHNRAAIEERRPILFTCIAETNVRVGPFVMPGETACFECFHHRLRANLSFREEFDSFVAYEAALESSGIESHAQLYARLASVLVCAQVANFLFGSLHHCAFDKILELCPITGEMTLSRLLKLPRCPVCGGAEESPPPASRDWV